MAYDFQKQMDFLLENVCAGIRHQVHRDMLGASNQEPFMKKLQEEVLGQPNVQKHLQAQHTDGWFGHELHGNDGMDCHIRGLLNLGVEASQPCIQRAVNALVTPEIAEQHKNWFRGGEALDADGRGGNRAVTAGILSWTGAEEDIPVLQEEIAFSLEHMRAVLQYHSLEDFSVRRNPSRQGKALPSEKRERYYKPGARFLGVNHISLLANTQSWRSEENLQMLKSAVRHGYRIMKDCDEYITFRKPKEYGSGFVGPFNFNWQALGALDEEGLGGILESPYPFQFGFWLRDITGLPEWARQNASAYELLADWLERDSPGADSGEGPESIPADCGQGAVLAERNECKMRHYFRGFGGMCAGVGRLTTKFCAFRQSSGSGMSRAGDW